MDSEDARRLGKKLMDRQINQDLANWYRWGLEYMMIRDPDQYVCTSSGLSGADIIRYEHDFIEFEEKRADGITAARARSPPSSADQPQGLEDEFLDGALEKEIHFVDCRPCRRFREMYESYRIHFKPGDDELTREIARGAPGLEDVVKLIREAQEAFRIYPSFDAYWHHIGSQQAQLLPFRRRDNR